MQGGAIHVFKVLTDAEFVKLFTKFRRTPRVFSFLFSPSLGEVEEELGGWVSRLVVSEGHKIWAERGGTARPGLGIRAPRLGECEYIDDVAGLGK